MYASGKARSFVGDTNGAAAVEFAIVGPMMFVLMIGILFYGGYFWTAHSVQQVANDCARAAVAGIDADERADIARDMMTSEMSSYPFLETTAAQMNIQDQADRIAVSLSYDASQSPFFSLDGFIPMPSSTITRQAVVRLGGY